MTTALGIENPNSKYNQEQRKPFIPDLPVLRAGQIRNLEMTIGAAEDLRRFKYRIGDIYGARLQGIRLGTMRAELRQLKGRI